MKKIVAVAGARLLAACGDAEAEVEPVEEAAEAGEQVSMAESPLVGSYGGTTDEGEPWTSTINADGSYEDTVGGEVTETGSWTHENDEICFNPSVMDGETAEQTCMALLAVNDDGSLQLRTPDGGEIMVPKLAEE